MIVTNDGFSQIEMGFANGTVCEVLCEKMRRFESVNMENAARCSCVLRQLTRTNR